MHAIGFSRCQFDEPQSSRLYTRQDETYNPVPMFVINIMGYRTGLELIRTGAGRDVHNRMNQIRRVVHSFG